MLYVYSFIALVKRGVITLVGEIRRYPDLCFRFTLMHIPLYSSIVVVFMLYVFDFIDLAKRDVITLVGEIRRYPDLCFRFFTLMHIPLYSHVVVFYALCIRFH